MSSLDLGHGEPGSKPPTRFQYISKQREPCDRLKKLDIIESVDYPTEWVSPIVVIQKNRKIKLCVDYAHLTKAVLRAHHSIGKAETILAKISGSNYFSKLDTNSEFYEIKLSTDSRLLTTFITPFGHKISNMGISVDPGRIQAISKFPEPKNK
ncbi:hypothetical protein HUJ05_008704 [Dendroctonus ponderosae]|nr:hypothetical protein HUJ05_008704 [Dendroctonus ponderosae]